MGKLLKIFLIVAGRIGDIHLQKSNAAT
jgi:hypothetical protein